jgi:hypothetical protein
MAANKRSKIQRDRDLQTAAALYLNGVSQAEIAERLGVSQPQICEDLQSIRAEWVASAVVDFGAKKAEELAKLDHLERVAWASWEESRNRYDADDVLLARRAPGDPRFLKQVESCIEKRLKALGLNAPEAFSADVSLRPAFVEVTDDELLAMGLARRGADVAPQD